MPELRKNPFVDRWVIIATERARRPGNIVDNDENVLDDDQKDCIYCHETQDNIYVHNDVTVVPVIDPQLEGGNNFKKESNGIYDVIEGVGHHEVVIETKDHIASMADLSVQQISDVFTAYGVRLEELRKNSDYYYVVAYKNYGSTAGSREIGHARSHIFATPVCPLRVEEKLNSANNHYQNHKSCIYCDLISQETAANERIILETDNFLVITPFAGQFLFEMLILPKEHHCDFSIGISGKEEELAGIMKQLLMKMKIGLDDAAYNYILQTAPLCAKDNPLAKSLQDNYHWHIEIMPRLTRMAGFEKGTGFYICSVPPEKTAEYFRGVDING